MTTLAEHLAALSPESLSRLVAARPDATAAPVPGSLGELAARLDTVVSASVALSECDALVQAVAEAAAALGPDLSREELLTLTGGMQGENRPAAERALARLVDLALVWPEGVEDLRMTEGLRRLWPAPLGLGPSLLDLLPDHTVAELKTMASTLGLPEDGRKGVLVDRIRTALSDLSSLTRAVHNAPLGTADLLETAARFSVVTLDFNDFGGFGFSSHRQQGLSPAGWAMRAGILHRVQFDLAVMSREAQLALRDSGSRLDLPDEVPDPASARVDAASVESGAGSSAASFVDHVRVLLEALAASPVAALKSGGIGVREIRRLAKNLGRTEPETVLALAVSHAAGLLDAGGAEVLATAAYDSWRDADPGRRYAVLLAAWWAMPFTAGVVDDEDGKVALLGQRPPRVDATALRQALVARLTEWPPGEGAASLTTVVDSVVFRRPQAYPETYDDHAQEVWTEAEALGVVVHASASPLARALVAGDADGLLAVCDALLPSTTGQATFQADLTAIVSGTPSAALAELLGSAAEVESRGAATVWRFSPVSVRRALDAGHTAEDLRASLEAAASRLPLPQPLTYLLSDVARRHGSVRVSATACVVVSSDEALLAEIVRTRGLAPLSLRTVAPTVLVSAKPVAETMRLLRSNGFSPVEQAGDGAVVLERVEQRRADDNSRAELGITLPGQGNGAASAAEALTLAAALAGTSLHGEPVARIGTLELGTKVANRIGLDGVRVLAHALQTGEPIVISYLDATRGTSTRVLSKVQPSGSDGIWAWCHLLGDHRYFSVKGILAASPID